MLCAIALASLTMTTANIWDQVDSAKLRATVEKLASFTTRNTLSPMLSESVNWLVSEYKKIPGVKAVAFEYTIPKGRRVPEDKKVTQAVAWLGEAKTLEELKNQRVVLVGGHLDSLNLQVEAETGRAPGANDDASGTALALECARILSSQKWPVNIVFVGWTGEEQGLHGSRALALFAKANQWKLEAVLSCDTVGSSSNKAKQKNTKQVRVFSDELETTNSRDLARWIEWNARQTVKNFGVKLVFRADRFGRGGDHTPFAQEGFDAVRFIEVHEEYTRQHTPDDLPEFMDWEYLKNVTKVNVASLAALASASPAPVNVRLVRDQSHDTTIQWQAAPGSKYRVYWRDTASPVWQRSESFVFHPAEGTSSGTNTAKFTVKGVNKDDHFFAVGAEGGVPVEVR